ncbi:MAG: hypothetical protein ACI9HK_004947 [Pirellulaceae bacterium]|jgi:hypothetical protein
MLSVATKVAATKVAATEVAATEAAAKVGYQNNLETDELTSKTI